MINWLALTTKAVPFDSNSSYIHLNCQSSLSLWACRPTAFLWSGSLSALLQQPLLPLQDKSCGDFPCSVVTRTVWTPCSMQLASAANWQLPPAFFMGVRLQLDNVIQWSIRNTFLLKCLLLILNIISFLVMFDRKLRFAFTLTRLEIRSMFLLCTILYLSKVDPSKTRKKNFYVPVLLWFESICYNFIAKWLIKLPTTFSLFINVKGRRGNKMKFYWLSVKEQRLWFF